MKKNFFKEIIAFIFLVCGFFSYITADDPAMAVTSNYKTFTDGSVLTAAELNALQTNYTNADNAILDGDTFTGNMLWHSGVDAIFYSDTGSTLTAAIYANSGQILGVNYQDGYTSNCGIAVSGTTLTIQGPQGDALSSTNPCFAMIENTTNGQIRTAIFRANVTVTFGSASDTDGNLFGISEANWSNAMPFFIGIVTDSTNTYFTISRKPITVTGSASTDVCQKNDTDCDAEGDVMILTTGLTLSGWVNRPITQVGWFEATYTTATTSWTFSLAQRTGFNNKYQTKVFAFPTGQMGASASTYMLPNGGTAAVFNTNTYNYKIKPSGEVTVITLLDADGGTDGASGVNTLIALPYVINGTGTFATSGISMSNATKGTIRGIAELQAGNAYYILLEATSGTNSVNSDFGNGNRRIGTTFNFNTLQ